MLMYDVVEQICSPKQEAAGPSVGPVQFFNNPVYYEEGLDLVTSFPRKQYSYYVSELMDRLGYSFEMIKRRQEMYGQMDKLNSRFEDVPIQSVTTGGKGEGTSLFYESDTDNMYIVKDLLCVEDPQNVTNEERLTYLQTERNETSPGYTRLKVLDMKENDFKEVITESLVEQEPRSKYISSQLFKEHLIRIYELDFGTTSGPSAPTYEKFRSLDNVWCFRCHCPELLKLWTSRPRHHKWPSPDIIKEISQLDGHAVPIGFKGSPNMHLEWRICYSLAELLLMRTLTETQIKVYILLKKKSVLNPICKNMTSYMMKNVVMWMCEANGVDRFMPDMLMDRLSDCINYLRDCVKRNNLPSYMITDRNLLAGRVDAENGEELVSVIGELIKEGGRVLLRCERIRDAMIVLYKMPGMFGEFEEKRDKLEHLLLIRVKLKIEIWKSGMEEEELNDLLAVNETFIDSTTRMNHLLQIDTDALLQNGKTYDEVVELWVTRLIQVLS